METLDSLSYCNSLTEYSRRATQEVTIGNVPMGAQHPIRIQSMTTVDTMDTIGTVEQSIRMIEAGCEYVRITAPSIREAKNLENIKKELKNRGYDVPLVADIHFTPNAAEQAARIVEKVGINPGNYADRKKFEFIEYTDQTYDQEIERIREKFVPLINICKEYGTALRIGTNHGSLSDRIMSRYGDTPKGMVESALEFLRICENESYYNIVLSMKASNPQVMVQAYRMLVNRMDVEGLRAYPLHLGVTEAGEGEDGRIKSAVGIGTLLEDGLGDTVRVSLTEEPEFEIPVAMQLVNRYQIREGHDPILPIETYPLIPFEFNRSKSREIQNIGGGNVPRVIADLGEQKSIIREDLAMIGHRYLSSFDKWVMDENGADYIYLGKNSLKFMLPNGLRAIVDFNTWVDDQNRGFPLSTIEEFKTQAHEYLNFVLINADDILIPTDWENKPVVFVLATSNEHAMAHLRRLFFDLNMWESRNPVIILRDYQSMSIQKVQVAAATDVGALLLDGFGEGIWLKSALNTNEINSTCFGILQATRMRITRTEYISCPSCGRTLFDLQETTAKIRKETDHLKGIKIAIMGCIVNGPGEMADADYGYVGAGPDKITLYKGKEVKQKGVPFKKAVGELIALIKKEGDWIDND